MKIRPTPCAREEIVDRLATFMAPEIGQFAAEIAEQSASFSFGERAIELEWRKQIADDRFPAGAISQTVGMRQERAGGFEQARRKKARGAQPDSPEITPV